MFRKSQLLLLLIPLVSSCGFSGGNKPKNVETGENDGFYEIFSGVSVNQKPGIYESKIENLQFKLDNPNDKLYFKLDENAAYQEYLGPFSLDVYNKKDKSKYPYTTSVDAINESAGTSRLYSNDYINNIQKTGNYVLHDKQPIVYLKYVSQSGVTIKQPITYFISTDIDFFKIPVVSLVCNYEDMFGSNGLYNDIWADKSTFCNLEYYDYNYDESFSRNTKLKLGGNWSLGYPQRTLNLNFNKDKDGKKNEKVTAHVFGEQKKQDGSGRINKLTRFRLHNGGNSFEERAGLNDAMMHMIMENTNISTTNFRPCITYLNGEYWGYYSIREHYSDVYFADNYGVDKDDVVVYEYKGTWNFDDGNEDEGVNLINELLNYIDTKDLSVSSNYNTFIDKYIDVDSLIDLFIVEAFAGNWDFVGNNNNLKMWRTVNVDPENPYADGRWRFCLHDIDFACFDDYQNYLQWGVSNSYQNFKMFHKLMQNNVFKAKFLERTDDLLMSNLSELNCAQILDRMITEILPFKIDSQIRWGKTKSYYDEFINNVNQVFGYFKFRANSFYELVDGVMR